MGGPVPGICCGIRTMMHQLGSGKVPGRSGSVDGSVRRSTARVKGHGNRRLYNRAGTCSMS